MHIILGRENVDFANLESKFVVLELDTFRLPPHGQLVEAFCVVENIPINHLARVDEMKTLHHNLLENYRKQDWNFCNQALEHLQGFWGSEVDSFYQSLQQRISAATDDDQTWQWVVDKTIVGT
jgi:hypothetical protein